MNLRGGGCGAVVIVERLSAWWMVAVVSCQAVRSSHVLGMEWKAHVDVLSRLRSSLVFRVINVTIVPSSPKNFEIDTASQHRGSGQSFGAGSTSSTNSVVSQIASRVYLHFNHAGPSHDSGQHMSHASEDETSHPRQRD